MRTSLVYRFYSLLRSYGLKVNPDNNQAVIDMKNELRALENQSISFRISTHEDGSWSAVSTNVDGIITGGSNQREINGIVKDAILTYYGIPASLVDDVKLRNSEEPVTVERNVHVTA